MAANTNEDLNIIAQAVKHLLAIAGRSAPTNDEVSRNNYYQLQVDSAISDLQTNDAGGDSPYYISGIGNG